MKESNDKTYNRTLFIGLIVISVLLVLGIAAAVFFPYYYKYVPRRHTTKYDTTYIKEGVELDENKALTLESFVKNYSFGTEITVSSTMEYARLSPYENPKYLYNCWTSKEDDQTINISFTMQPSKYEMKSCNFVVGICYSDGSVYKTIERDEYQIKSFENNSCEIEFLFAKYCYIGYISVNFSFI